MMSFPTATHSLRPTPHPQSQPVAEPGSFVSKMVKTSILVFLALASAVLTASAGKPTTENKVWEEACGGSNIAVTSMDGKLVSLDAFVEHFAEGRQWECQFKDGKIVSATYHHFTVSRKSAGEAGEFTTELTEDRVEVFHFPDHQIAGMDPSLEKDLVTVLGIATTKSEQGAAPNP